MNPPRTKASKIFWALLMLLFLEIPISSAQVLEGTVKSETGESLAGVNVVVSGTTIGAVTDIEGNFSLTEVHAQDVLQISYVGYISQEIEVGAQSFFDIEMEPDATLLDKIVIVGYGTQQKINLTGAVGIAEGEVLENRPIANVAEGLQGVIPNLNIMVPSADPSDDRVDFNIRGFESINGGEPLIVVDGIPMALSNLNPNDIESISVLKDAAASAIYGGRAAFGVILVQTKRGRSDKMNLSAGAEFAWAKPIFFRDPVTDPHQYALAMNQAQLRHDNTVPFDQNYIDNTLRWTKDPNDENAWGVYNKTLRFYGSSDYTNELFADSAPQQRYNVNVSGASENASYYVSFGYLNKDGYLSNSKWNQKFKRYNVLMKGEFSIEKWLSADSKIQFSSEHSDKPHQYPTVGIWSALHSAPLDPIAFPDLPYYIEPGDREKYEPMIGMYIGANNPFPYLEDGGRDRWTRNDLVLTQGFTIRPLKSLNIKADFSYNPRWFNREDVQSTVNMIKTVNNSSSIDLVSNDLIFKGQSADDWIHNWSDNDQYFVINAYADYTLDLSSGHYLKGMIGFNQEWGLFESMSAKAFQLISPDVADLNTTTGQQQTSGGSSDVALRGYFYRFNYIYKDRYLLEANGRYDGTSRFPKDDRWAFFPSFSVGWRLSNESFMSGASGWLNNLKLRASYGELGNQLLYNFRLPENWDKDAAIMGEIGAQYRFDNDPVYYPYLPSMTAGDSPYMFTAGKRSPFVSAAPLVSSTLTWETVSTTNLGLDFTMFKNRLDLAFDLYTRYTKDMLMRVTYPDILGANAPEQNAADLETSGWELMATWRDRVKADWNYEISLAFSDNITEITRYNNPTGSLDEYYVGQIIGERWGYETVGIFQNEEQVNNAANQDEMPGVNYSNWRPGDIQYADLNDDDIIDKGGNRLDSLGDQRIIAYESPRYNFGVTAKASWKTLSLSLFFQGTLKFDYWSPPYSNRSFYPYWTDYVEQFYLTDSWSPENLDAYYPAPHSFAAHNFEPQSRYVQDASYVRLKNITLAYDLPQSIADKIALQNLTVYFSGENLWEHTNLRKPLDPETRPTSFQANFKQRVYSLGLKVSL